VTPDQKKLADMTPEERHCVWGDEEACSPSIFATLRDADRMAMFDAVIEFILNERHERKIGGLEYDQLDDLVVGLEGCVLSEGLIP
jgi:hypothetical protein